MFTSFILLTKIFQWQRQVVCKMARAIQISVSSSKGESCSLFLMGKKWSNSVGDGEKNTD